MIANLVLSIVGPGATEAQLEAMNNLGIRGWREVNERIGRVLVDCVGPSEILQSVHDRLVQMGRSPIIIGVWRRDGTRITQFPLNKPAFLDVAPDLVDYTDPDSPVYSRPTVFVDVHRFQGWAPRQG